ncbi:hypothetical protein TKK_0001579 [Trichogramma kaykai]
MLSIYGTILLGTMAIAMDHATQLETNNPGIVFHQESGLVTFDVVIKVVMKITLPVRSDLTYDLAINRLNEFNNNKTFRDLMLTAYESLIKTKILTNNMLPKTDQNSELPTKQIDKYMNIRHYEHLDQRRDNVVLIKCDWNERLWRIMSRIDYKIELFNTLKPNEHKKALEIINTIHALETDRLSLVIDFGKFIEVLTNSHKVSAAITIGQY